jgi:hypothetical protein
MNVYEWIVSGNTGTSSKTIWSHFVINSRPGGNFGAMTPSDPSDFLRCYWLLKLAPEWRDRIAEMGQRYPEWKPLTDNWDELEKMIESVWPKSCASGYYELNETPAKAMYDRMQVLLEEGRELLRKARISQAKEAAQ